MVLIAAEIESENPDDSVSETTGTSCNFLQSPLACRSRNRRNRFDRLSYFEKALIIAISRQSREPAIGSASMLAP
jgi:hypothetical protein